MDFELQLLYKYLNLTQVHYLNITQLVHSFLQLILQIIFYDIYLISDIKK